MKKYDFPRKALFGILVVALPLCGCHWKQVDSASVPAGSEHPLYAAVARGKVDVDGGLIKIAPSRDGILLEASVKEGDHVEKGQVLAVIDDRAIRLGADLAKKERTQASSSIEGIKVKLSAAERGKARFAQLNREGAISRAENEQAEDQAKILQVELRQAQESLAAAETRIALQEQEADARRIVAPESGKIVQCTVRAGSAVGVSSPEPMFLLAPDTARIVKAELEEPFVPAVSVGLPVEITADNDASRTCKGTVIRMGEVLMPKVSAGNPTEKSDVSVVDCYISLDDQSLLIGQRVLVRVLAAGAEKTETTDIPATVETGETAG